mmetsp:Transcript_12742/g.30320  ORF Transcript_12742/g.30320 Transcript_12742/m.30320 type:complete len:99 (+) Transcript_12742:1158-1454(+)
MRSENPNDVVDWHACMSSLRFMCTCAILFSQLSSCSITEVGNCSTNDEDEDNEAAAGGSALARYSAAAASAAAAATGDGRSSSSYKGRCEDFDASCCC